MPEVFKLPPDARTAREFNELASVAQDLAKQFPRIHYAILDAQIGNKHSTLHCKSYLSCRKPSTVAICSASTRAVLALPPLKTERNIAAKLLSKEMLWSSAAGLACSSIDASSRFRRSRWPHGDRYSQFDQFSVYATSRLRSLITSSTLRSRPIRLGRIVSNKAAILP